MPVFHCLSCQRLLFRPNEFLGRAWQCPNCGPVNVSDEPASVSPELAALLAEEYRLGLSAGPSVEGCPEENPLSRISRKRSLIMSEPDPQPAKPTARPWIVFLATTLCAILFLSVAFIDPGRVIVECLLLGGGMAAVSCGILLRYAYRVVVDVRRRRKKRMLTQARLQQDSPFEKFDSAQPSGAVSGEKSDENSITPSPSLGTIQPHPENEEPTDA